MLITLYSKSFVVHILKTMKKSQVFLVDEVEKKLLDYFKSHNIKIGDVIPKELELVEILGVSRTVVREALSRLRTQGLLETKRRKGTILKNPDLSVVLEKSMIPQLMDEDTLKDYFEMRLSLEIGMADLIMQRKTTKDIEELREIVAKEPKASANQIFKTDYEIEFHGKLYSITQNESMKKFQNLLLPLFEYVHNSGMLDNYENNESYVSHGEIVEIIATGDANTLRSALRKHLDSHFKRILN